MIYNGDRIFVKILKEICKEEGISLTMTSYDWMGRMEKNGKSGSVWGYQLPENSAAAHLICKDKSGVYDFLTAEGVPAVPHFLFITPKEFAYLGVTSNWDRMRALLEQYGTVVVKPNEGTGGDCVLKASTPAELETCVTRVFEEYRTVAISPFLEIDAEYRVVISDGKVRLVFSKIRPFVEGDGKRCVTDLAAEKYPGKGVETEGSFVPAKGERAYLSWHHNLGLGAYAERVTDEGLLSALEKIAAAAANAVGITFASVDVVSVGGKFAVLEINSGVMTERFARESEENYELAKGIYREAILRYFGGV